MYSISTFCLLALLSEGAATLPYSRLSVSSSSLRRLRYAPKSGAQTSHSRCRSGGCRGRYHTAPSCLESQHRSLSMLLRLHPDILQHDEGDMLESGRCVCACMMSLPATAIASRIGRPPLFDSVLSKSGKGIADSADNDEVEEGAIEL